MHRMNSFVEGLKDLTRYGFKNNFGLSKYYINYLI